MPTKTTQSSEIVYLNSLIDKASSDCLNSSEGHSLAKMFTCSDADYLQSDADAQLLINIVFS